MGGRIYLLDTHVELFTVDNYNVVDMIRRVIRSPQRVSLVGACIKGN